MLNVFIQNKNAPTFCNTFGILYMFLSSHYNHTSTYMTCMKTNDMVIEILAIQIQPTQQVLKNNIHIIFITILNKGNARKYSKWCPFHRRGGEFK